MSIVTAGLAPLPQAADQAAPGLQMKWNAAYHAPGLAFRLDMMFAGYRLLSYRECHPAGQTIITAPIRWLSRKNFGFLRALYSSTAALLPGKLAEP